ncbi:hypothetical protein FQZ97_639380 [compost metagenome]
MGRLNPARMRHGEIDGPLIDAWQVVRLPVVAPSLGLRGVEQALHLRVGPARHDVGHRPAKRAQRCDQCFSLFDLAGVADEDGHDRLAVHLLREPGGRRRDPQNRHAGQFARGLCAERTVGVENLPGVVAAPCDRTAQDFGADGKEPVLEGGDDAEVAAAAAQRPEQVLVLVRRRTQDLAAGRHDLHRDHVVAGPAVATREVAESAADGEARDPGGRHKTEHGGEPVQLCLAVDVAQRAARLRARRATRWIDPDTSEQRHVDHEAALADRKPCDVVAAAAHGTQKPVLAREPDGLHDIDRAGAARHQARAAIDHRVPDLARLLVGRVLRGQHLAFERGLERLQNFRRKVHGPAVHACELGRHESSPKRVMKSEPACA